MAEWDLRRPLAGRRSPYRPVTDTCGPDSFGPRFSHGDGAGRGVEPSVTDGEGCVPQVPRDEPGDRPIVRGRGGGVRAGRPFQSDADTLERGDAMDVRACGPGEGAAEDCCQPKKAA